MCLCGTDFLFFWISKETVVYKTVCHKSLDFCFQRRTPNVIENLSFDYGHTSQSRFGSSAPFNSPDPYDPFVGPEEVASFYSKKNQTKVQPEPKAKLHAQVIQPTASVTKEALYVPATASVTLGTNQALQNWTGYNQQSQQVYQSQALQGQQGYQRLQTYQGQQAYQDQQVYQSQQTYKDQQPYQSVQAYPNQQGYYQYIQPSSAQEWLSQQYQPVVQGQQQASQQQPNKQIDQQQKGQEQQGLTFNQNCQQQKGNQQKKKKNQKGQQQNGPPNQIKNMLHSKLNEIDKKINQLQKFEHDPPPKKFANQPLPLTGEKGSNKTAKQKQLAQENMQLRASLLMLQKQLQQQIAAANQVSAVYLCSFYHL